MSGENVKQLVESIAEINKKMNTAKEAAKNHVKSTPGTMNIAEIMNRNHLENQHSNIIGFLVDPEEKHHHPEYGKQFIQLLRNKGLGITSDTITYVNREESTYEARRIDLLIETEDAIIIVENKIYAGDQSNQISDYIEFVKESNSTVNEIKIFVVYLTLDNKKPSEISLPSDELKKLVDEHRYINLTYKTDITTWLKNLKFKQEEQTLQAAILQYIDVVEGLTQQRKEILNMKNELAKEIFNAYSGQDSTTFRTMLRNVNQFNKTIRLTVYIKFFEDLYKELEKADKKATFYCCGKSEYKDEEEWIKAVTEKQTDFGVYYQHPDGYTEALIVDDAQSDFIFAIKSDKNDSEYENKLNRFKKIKKDGYQIAGNPDNNWFINAVFCEDFKNGKTWEEDQKKTLAYHVASTWF